jgi:hypothetical protein
MGEPVCVDARREDAQPLRPGLPCVTAGHEHRGSRRALGRRRLPQAWEAGPGRESLGDSRGLSERLWLGRP